MNVTIEIHYISNETKVMQGGTFPLRRRNQQQVAWEFWQQIKQKMPFGAELEKVIIDGEDKTVLVKQQEAPLE
ncbi:hypothetical protein [Neobacillus niacini]|uniref:hypothetical protein n=1 Tax=Neobacillus niacini TaxID=86668 RepID=UPI0021CAFA5D|nr:hypothetical protein [Neobacillus niacini]MCM3763425.1 hypothetical protein [Neobacillus niacini]